MSGAGGGSFSDLANEIRRRAERCEVRLSETALARLVDHANAVVDAEPHLHLTAIRDPQEFAERHLAEAFEGAAMLDEHVTGTLVDLGSGNGYPGIPVAAARPGLTPVLVEGSTVKAAFLSQCFRNADPPIRVLNRHVQTARDLESIGNVRVLVTRAMGGWERVLPKLASCFEPEGQLLVWAGTMMEKVARRAAWKRYELTARRTISERNRSWVWLFRVLRP